MAESFDISVSYLDDTNQFHFLGKDRTGPISGTTKTVFFKLGDTINFDLSLTNMSFNIIKSGEDFVTITGENAEEIVFQTNDFTLGKYFYTSSSVETICGEIIIYDIGIFSRDDITFNIQEKTTQTAIIQNLNRLDRRFKGNFEYILSDSTSASTAPTDFPDNFNKDLLIQSKHDNVHIVTEPDKDVHIWSNLVIHESINYHRIQVDKNDLTIAGDFSFNNNVEISNHLLVQNDASFNNIVEISNHLLVNGDASFNNIVEISNHLLVQNDASFNNIVEISNQLIVSGDASFNVVEISNQLIVNGDASFHNVVEISNQLIVNGDASFNVVEISNQLIVSGDASFHNVVEISNQLIVSGDASFNVVEISNQLIVNGDASFHNVVEISNQLIVNGDASFNNVVEISNQLIVSGDASFNNVVEISNNLIVKGVIDISNNPTIFIINNNSTTVLINQIFVDENGFLKLKQ